MKKVSLLIQAFLVTILLVGCQFSEDLHINEDGTGKISFNFDGSEIMQMGGDKITEGKEEVIDSTLVFKDFLEEKKDSIAQLPKEEQEKLKKLESFKMHMLMNPQSKEMKFDLYSEFKKVEELGDVFNSFKTASTIGNQKKASPAGDPLAGSKGEDPTEVIYSYGENKFKRITKILDKDKLEMSLDSLEQMKMFLASSKYKINYHFPKKIKKISSEKAMFSQDGKSFTLEVGFLEYMADPTVLDVEVELEK
ncbi:hypothetical protein SAMN04487910_3201 [Aquimarina amphilecti]|uniref:Lipoprotein n=1 Tax=Aquimarina amphilecti TaxID=1038014 RepID=A0A1H7SJZ8_AQUAM|nr:hypothetical protein [Aquimarina amphilecti]SEL73011.1 hypothetical protein SAMN04487910_3201 [Aquimarina amphilecti]